MSVFLLLNHRHSQCPVSLVQRVKWKYLLVFLREANPNQVSFGGVVKGESAMVTEEEIGSLITYKFRVCLLLYIIHLSIAIKMILYDLTEE